MEKTSGMALALPKGYSRGTHTVLTRYSHGTQWVGTRQAAAGVRDGEDVGDGARVADRDEPLEERLLVRHARGVPTVRHATVLAGLDGYPKGTHSVL